MFNLFAKKPAPTTTLAAPAIPKTAALFNETVVDRFYNLFTNISDPDMLLKSLGKTRKDLRALDTDDEVSAAMDTRRDACLCASWRLESQPGANDDFIRQELTLWLPEIINVAFNSLPFGYSVAEIIYERREGRVGLASVTEKPFEWFEPQTDGTLLWLTPYGTREPLDIDYKFLLTRRSASYRNPFGEALYSRLYWPWYFRHNAWLFWMRFLERFGEPLILGKVNDVQGMISALQAMGINSAVAVHPDEDVKAVLANASGEFEKVETALAKRIQKSILGQTLTSDVSGGGSYAASQTHNEVRKDKRNSDLRTITPAVNQVIKALWLINGFAGPLPVFAFQDDANIDKPRADRDAVLAEAGICSFTEEYLLRVYDFEQGDIAPPVQQPAGEAVPVKMSKNFALPVDRTDDRVTSNLAAAADPVMSNWIDTLHNTVSHAKSLEQLRDTILDVYPDMDTAALAEVMMQQQMIARCVGMLEVKSEDTGISGVAEMSAQPVIHLEQKPATFNITMSEQPQPIINIINQQEAQEPPVVNLTNQVNVPDQQPPTVNVSAAAPVVNVAPAAVTVENSVVMPARNVTIERNQAGQMTGARVEEN
jgi:phage gp29-like protein